MRAGVRDIGTRSEPKGWVRELVLLLPLVLVLAALCFVAPAAAHARGYPSISGREYDFGPGLGFELGALSTIRGIRSWPGASGYRAPDGAFFNL